MAGVSFEVKITFAVKEAATTDSVVDRASLSGVHFVCPRESGGEVYHQDVSRRSLRHLRTPTLWTTWLQCHSVIGPLCGLSIARAHRLFTNLLAPCPLPPHALPTLDARCCALCLCAEQRPSHMFTHGFVGDTRGWFPCVDDWRMKCTWNIRLAVAPSLVAVSCGLLKAQGLTPDKHHMVFQYQLDEPTPACYIGCAVGPFEAQVCAEIPSVTYYTLPGMETLVASSTKTHLAALKCIEDTLNVEYESIYPTHSFVFVDEAYAELQSYTTLSLMSCNLLVSPKNIEQTLHTRGVLMEAVARQFFTHYITFHSWLDIWLIEGLVGYFQALHCLQTLGAWAQSPQSSPVVTLPLPLPIYPHIPFLRLRRTSALFLGCRISRLARRRRHEPILLSWSSRCLPPPTALLTSPRAGRHERGEVSGGREALACLRAGPHAAPAPDGPAKPPVRVLAALCQGQGHPRHGRHRAAHWKGQLRRGAQQPPHQRKRRQSRL